MIRVTEIVFGLEKMWLHRHHDARIMPWHICILGLIPGIILGQTCGRGLLGQTLLLVVLALDLVISLLLHLWFQPQPYKPSECQPLTDASQPKPCHCRHKRACIYWMSAWMLLWLVFGMYLGQPGHHQQMPENTPCLVTGRLEQIPPGTTQARAVITDWRCESQTAQPLSRHPFYAQIKLTPEEISAANGLARGQWFQANAVFTRFQAPDVPGMFDARSWARSENLSGRLKRTTPGWHQLSEPPSTLRASLEIARRRAFEILSQHSPKGIVPALILGSSRQIDDATRDTFGRLGIAHVLAVSGLHFGIIALIIVFVIDRMARHSRWIMRRFGRSRFAAAAAIPALLLYLFFVGAPISAQRALIMATCCCLARLFCRKPNRPRALIQAAILILILDPMAVFAISFQLSFSAVLGIIWGMDFYETQIRLRIAQIPISSPKRKFLSVLASTLIMTVSTSLTTAPFVVAHFGQLPVLGIFANLVVIPYVSFVLMPLSIVAALWIITGLPGTTAVASVTGFAESILTGFAEGYIRHVPASCFDMPSHPFLLAGLAITSALILCHFRPTRLRLVPTLMATMLVTAAILCAAVNPRIYTASGDLRLTFVSMGQADATLIEFPNGQIMLVDIGSEIHHSQNAGQARMMPYLKRHGIRHIDTIVLTHADYDHVAGLLPILEHCTVGRVWYNGLDHDETPFWQAALRQHHVPLIDITRQPSQIAIGEAQVRILWPTPDGISQLRDQNLLNENEASIVMRLEYGAFSAMLMGDAGVTVENAVLSRETIHPVTVLKVGHHGSKSASSEEWIGITRPKFAIYSVGAHNRYHFPHREVENRLFHHQTQTYRTDRQGTIRMTTNGRQLLIETMRH